MNKLPLQPIEWREYGNINGTSVDAITPICEYDIYLSNNEPGYIVAYYNRHTEAPTKEATGFATIDEAKAWAWKHYNEKMQPYVKPAPTWISVKDKLPTHHQDVIVYRYDGEQSSIDYSLYFNYRTMAGFTNVADEDGFFDDVYYWQPIETKALYEAMHMQLQINEGDV